jgi:hypothetical protein
MIIFLKKQDRRIKHIWGWYQREREDTRKGVGRRTWWKYHALTYENGKMRPLETILEMGG